MSTFSNLIFPIKIIAEPYFSNVTDVFGFRKWRNRNHNGIDLGGRGKQGQELYTPYDGVVIRSSYDSKAGNAVVINHGSGFVTYWFHLKEIYVKNGQQVSRGQCIGTLGNTGRSTGAHLHFGIKIDGQWVDPSPYLYGYAVVDDSKDKGKKAGQFAIDNSVNFRKSNKIKPKIQSRIANLPESLHDIQHQNAEKIIKICQSAGATKEDIYAVVCLALASSNLLSGSHTGVGKQKAVGVLGLAENSDWGSTSQLQNIEHSINVFLNGTSKRKGLLKINRQQLTVKPKCKAVLGNTEWEQFRELRDLERYEDNSRQLVDYYWVTQISSELNTNATEKLENTEEQVTYKEVLAAGIWQIIKVIVDDEVADKIVNDASVAFLQGSLYSFIEKICQKPFVEFFADTYGDQFYFVIRKPPFTRKSFTTLQTFVVSDKEVISDSLSWADDQVYSWYQLTPNANYIGVNTSHFNLIKAIFFPEYAEIYGSRPLSVVSNYITFLKRKEEDIHLSALQDLKFIIDINSYLPFTRKGTITIHGDRRIKKGTRIYYEPTDEYFYVDAVAQHFSAQNGVIDRVTVLTVSRGMVKQFVDVEVENSSTKSYFNLINYGDLVDKSPTNKGLSKQYDDVNIYNTLAYFNQDFYTFDYDNIDNDDKVIIKDKKLFQNVDALNNDNELLITKSIVDFNLNNCKEIAEIMFKYKNIKFYIVGYTDSVATISYNNDLGLNRANNCLNVILQFYKERFNSTDEEIEQQRKRFILKTFGEHKAIGDSTVLKRLKNRKVEIYTEKQFIEKNKNKIQYEKEAAIKDGSWKVNKDVFLFFLRRQQFADRDV